MHIYVQSSILIVCISALFVAILSQEFTNQNQEIAIFCCMEHIL